MEGQVTLGTTKPRIPYGWHSKKHKCRWRRKDDPKNPNALRKEVKDNGQLHSCEFLSTTTVNDLCEPLIATTFVDDTCPRQKSTIFVNKI